MSWNLIASKDYNLLIASKKKYPPQHRFNWKIHYEIPEDAGIYIYNLQFFFNYVV